MEFKGTPGTWVHAGGNSLSETIGGAINGDGKTLCLILGKGIGKEQAISNAKLIAAAPELLEALNKAADYMWEDTRVVRFDPTMIFGCGYDFDGWDDFREELHTKIGSFAVWQTGVRNEYYAYGGADGIFWNDGFKSKQDARDAVISYITKLDPSHPAVIANHAIRKALGGE